MKPDSAILPPLRRELEILPGAAGHDGVESWVIHDPMQHRYFRIDAQTRFLLSLWRQGLSLQQMARLASERLGLSVGEGQIAGVLKFVRDNQLTFENQAGGWQRMAQDAARARPSPMQGLIRKYFYFRVPLLHPQRLLERLSPAMGIFYSQPFLIALAGLAMAGIFLISRQWDQFIHGFNIAFAPNGLIYYLIALVFLKALHELGHAFTAVRFGCRVPTMGIAFIFLTPLLYTDVSDAWRLSCRRQRMLISVAGVLTELAVAIVASFAWSFLPEGNARQLAFAVATTGWIMSLTLNLNPCMKFDGYYLLSDILKVDNLQPRAFALGRWKLRQVLIAPKLAPPEKVPATLGQVLIVYAWITWGYRLVVFSAIAGLVYYFYFKLLGLVLFAAVIWLLIVKPVAMELAQWRRIAPELISRRRGAISLGAALAALLALAVPWTGGVRAPAVLMAADLTQIYPVRPARLVAVSATPNMKVARGTPLFQLGAPGLDKDIERVKIEHDLVRLRLARTMSDKYDREQSLILKQRLSALQTELQGLLQERKELVIRAPLSGTVLEVHPNLHVGRWVKKTDRLALIASGRKYRVSGYVPEADLARLKSGADGAFIADDPGYSRFPVRLAEITPAAAGQIGIAELASVNGGGIAVRTDARERLIPTVAQYQIELAPSAAIAAPNQLIRGVVHLEGRAESYLSRAWHRLSRLVMRESGF